MNDEIMPLNIQDVIELLTNIKLKHGNLPVYIEGEWLSPLTQNDINGIHYCEASTAYGTNELFPEHVEIVW